jgi:iron complex outermembrane receptor protein
MTTQHNRSRYSIALLSSLATVLLTAATGYSQTTAGTDEAVKLQKFEVTGSYIPAAADESKAMPIQVLDAAAIEETGINSSVLDVLRKAVPQIEGPGNMGQENANTGYNSNAGGSMVAIHGLSTLVLIDGKRVASSPIASAGGYNFVDLNLIPVSAVERIDVLTDGASAIYGADAVSGVVNIIMKKNFQGGIFAFNYSGAQKDFNGWAHDRNVSMTFGAATKNTSVLVSAQWFKSEPLFESDFNMTNPYYGTSSYPGVINSAAGAFYTLKPGLNAPPTPAAGTVAPTIAQLIANGTYVANSNVAAGFNLGVRPTFQSGNQKKIANFNINHDFSDKYTLSSSFMYSNTETGSELNPQPITASIASIVGAPGIPVSDTTGYTIRNRFLGFPNRQYTTVNNFYRFTLDFSGKINEYINFDAFINYNSATELERDHNLILNSALLAGIKAGQINMFAINQNAANITAANIFGTAFGNYESFLLDKELVFHGKIIELPSGEISYAAGAAYRKENLTASADYNSQVQPGGGSLWNNGTTINPFNQGFNNTSTFAEVKIPVTSPKNGIPFAYLLTLDGAMRHESYSSGNKVTVPKYSVRYLPINDQIALRATIGKSFQAPSLYDLYGPTSSGFTSSPGGLNVYNSSGVATGAKFPNLQAQAESGSNPNLGPQTSKTKTAGFVLSPRFLKGFEFTLDYYTTKLTDQIGTPASALTMMQDVEAKGTASPFAQYVTIGGFPGAGGRTVTAPGQVSANIVNIYVQSSLSNIAGTSERGMDFSAKYTFQNETYGRFTVASNWANMRSYFVKSGPTSTGTEYAGFAEGGSLAKLRSYSTLQYAYRGFGATLGYTHIPQIPDMSGGFESPWNTFDLQTRFDLGKLVDSSLNGVSVNLGLNNVSNQKPPIDANVFGNPPADTGTYGIFGRQFYVDLKYKF